MIREQSRFTINPLYVVAIGLCAVCEYVDTLQQGLLFGLLTAVVCLLCVNLVSLVERIADKNLRAFLIAMLSAALVVVLEYACELIGWELLIENAKNLKWIVIAVIALSIVPTYFETRLTTKHYFDHMFLSVIAFVLQIVIYSVVIEILGYGTIWNIPLFGAFSGFVFARQLYFRLFLIGVIVIISNLVYQLVEDRKMKYEILVEKYKIQIKQVLTERDKKEGQRNG